MWLRLVLGGMFLLVALGLFLQPDNGRPIPETSAVLLVLPPVKRQETERAYLLGTDDCNGEDETERPWFAKPMPALHADCILIKPGVSQVPVTVVAPNAKPLPMVLRAELSSTGRYGLFWPNGTPVDIQGGIARPVSAPPKP
mgnify:CR=1 FL=1